MNDKDGQSIFGAIDQEVVRYAAEYDERVTTIKTAEPRYARAISGLETERWLMAKGFASTGDTADKTISFDEIGRDLYAFTAEGDPNSGIIIGDDGVMVVDAQATPVMALEVIERVRKVTDKPIKYVLLSHYHAVRVLGASAYDDAEILASDATRDLIVERGQQDRDLEIGRFPRLLPCRRIHSRI